MKAIFEKNFLEDLKRVDNILELTKYVIGSKYNNINLTDKDSISKLFSGEYLNSDTRKTESYQLNSIWESNKKLLKINISIPEKEKEKLVEPSYEYDFIYCYCIYPDGEEKIAIIFSEIDEDSKEFNRLSLNLSSNIIELTFPEDCIATILTTLDSDTKFLEGIGVISGINIFNYPEDIEEDTNILVSKKSYYKFIRNNKTEEDSNSFLYNNIFGEKIYSNSYSKEFKEITLDSIEDVSELNESGGHITLIGEVYYDLYKVINDYDFVRISSNKCNILSINNLEIIVESNTGIDLEIDSVNKKIYYKSNSTGTKQTAKIKLRVVNINLSNKKLNVIESPELLLIQN